MSNKGKRRKKRESNIKRIEKIMNGERIIYKDGTYIEKTIYKDGYWEERKYDKEGNLIFYLDKEGHINEN